MNTRVIPVSSPEALPLAIITLESGGLVAFPTDTVYGLGAQVFNVPAVESIYQAKMRPAEKAIPVLLAGVDDLNKVATNIPKMALALAAAFWPGAITLVVPRHPDIPLIVSAVPTIGVRVPGHDFARELLHLAGPLAVSSANFSDRPSPMDAGEVLAQLNGRIPLIVDGGKAPGGQSSTVVDCTGLEPKILRAGPISLEQVLKVLHYGK